LEVVFYLARWDMIANDACVIFSELYKGHPLAAHYHVLLQLVLCHVIEFLCLTYALAVGHEHL